MARNTKGALDAAGPGNDASAVPSRSPSYGRPRHAPPLRRAWKNGKKDGEGRLTTADSEYVGSWKNGSQSGMGKWKRLIDGEPVPKGEGEETYDGEFAEDKRHGTGKAL